MDDNYELPPSSPADMSMMELSDSDDRIWCDRCNCTLVDEWWHCDLCDDYDICYSCIGKKLRCKDDSHDLTKWVDNVYYGNGVNGPGPTDIKLPGILNRWAAVEDTHPTAHNGWGCVDDSMAGVWGDVDSSANWDGLGPTSTPPDPPNPETTSPSSDHLDLIYEVLLPPLPSASDTAPTTKREHSAMSNNPTTTAPAAPTATGQHFKTIREARTYLNSTVARWTPPTAPSDTSTRPTTPSAEYAYVHAAIHSITIGLAHTPLGHHLRTATAAGDTNAARLLEARAWLLFDALKQLHDGGCVLRASMDFSDAFGSEFKDRELGFRARWVAVCRILQRFGSAAEMVASGRGEEILEVYVAAPGAMGRKLEEERREREEGEERERKRVKMAQSTSTVLD